MATIDIPNLVELAGRTDGQAHMGELVRRLIWATLAKRGPAVHFLSGASNNEAGWDGTVQCSIDVGDHDDMHYSLWEISTQTKAEQKIRDDYKSALAKPLPLSFQCSKDQIVYVAATLQKLTRTKKQEIAGSLARDFGNPWGKIIVLDANDFVQWVEKVPGVEDWLADKFSIGRARFGRALEHTWTGWSNKTVPPVNEKLVCSGRNLAVICDALKFSGRSTFSLKCDSIDEAVALLYSAIRTLPDKDSSRLLANALVVTDELCARNLALQPVAQNALPLTVLAPPATTASQLLVGKGHRVVHVLARHDGEGSPIIFERAGVHEFALVLADSMGLRPADANSQARACGCSASVWHIRNLFKQSLQPVLPIWADVSHADAVVPAVLLGAWCEISGPDAEAIQALTGLTSAAFTDKLRQFQRCENPLLEFIGEDRFIVAPTAAFEFVARHVSRQHIDKFADACKLVFSTITTEVSEHWAGNEPPIRLRNRKTEHSDSLLKGLAETLLRIAVLGRPLEESGIFSGFQSAQHFVNSLVGEIPNLLTNPRVMASFNQQLPYLIEAAPDTFLSALNSIAQGDQEELKLWLSDEEGVFGRSYHTGLLWGLEALAWTDEYLPRVAVLLAHLASADPGGKTTNRPLNSLIGIFLAWHPGTDCSINQRLEAIQEVLRAVPKIGWMLLMALMPGVVTIAHPTSRPKWRLLEQRQHQDPSKSEISAAFQLYVDLALKGATQSAGKLADIIPCYPMFTIEHRTRLEQELIAFADSTRMDSESLQVWNALHQLTSHHRSFAGAAWAMAVQHLDCLEKIADRFLATDLVERYRWLFDHLSPDTGHRADDFAGTQKNLEQLRTEALEAIISNAGWPGIGRLVLLVKFPHLVGHIAAGLAKNLDDILDAIELWRKSGTRSANLAISAASSICATKDQAAWTTKLHSASKKHDWSRHDMATAILEFPDTEATFQLLDSLPEDVKTEYWTRRYGFLRLDAERPPLLWTATQAMIANNRAIDLVDLNWPKLRNLGSDRVMQVLDACMKELGQDSVPARIGMIAYELQQLLSWLRAQPDVAPLRTAQYEYALLPLLQSQGEGQDLSIHQMLKEEPTFFVEVICDVYKSAAGNQTEDGRSQDEIEARATVASRLLDSWRSPPGTDGELVDVTKLENWIDVAQQKLAEVDRFEIGNQQIGKVLFHFPPDPSDGVWPHLALRKLLERIKSNSIENGIILEAFNARGVNVRAMFAGGQPERDLQAKWLAIAEKTDPQWTRARKVCFAIADQWRRQAKDEDLYAKRQRAEYSR